MDLYATKFSWNHGWRGAAIELRDYSYMRGNLLKFEKNTAFYSAGGIYISTFSWMDLLESDFRNNYAPSNSAIEVL
jgi:hypothetical protein